MRRRWMLFAALGLMLGGISGPPGAAAELTERVDALFAEWDHDDTPGCALGVMRDGELVYGRGYGLASLEHRIPIATTTVFRTGSVGKQFTALAVLLAEAAGHLSLGDDIRDHLPELENLEVPVTIEQLVHHTSGLRDYLDLMYLAGYREEAHYDNRQVLEVLAGQQTLNFEPGSDYLYSNTGYFLLSQIVERATGKTLREWSREAMFVPLGMDASHFHDDPWMVVPNRAYGYSRREEGGFQVNMTTLEMVGDGGVFTTIEDMVAWERNYLEPKVGGPEVLAKRLATGELTDGTPQIYAAGLTVRTHRGLPVVQHGGAFVGFRAATVRFPEDRLAVHTLCNVGDSDPMALAHQVAELYLGDRLEAEVESPPEAASAQELADLVGTWVDPRSVRPIEVTLEEGELRVSFGGEPWTVVESTEEGREFDLYRDGQRWGLVVDPKSVGGGLSVLREGRRPIAFERVEPAEADVTAYLGRYRSEELDVTWEIALAEDGQLTARLPPLDDAPLQSSYRDAFTWDWGHAVFERDTDGRVIAMRFGTGRAQRLRMVRVVD